jgi:hypothetical protein
MMMSRPSKPYFVIWSCKSGAVVVPAGAGLVASAPPGPVQVMADVSPCAGEQVEQTFYLDGLRCVVCSADAVKAQPPLIRLLGRVR